VKLFRYPSLDKAAQAHEHIGHSSHVTNVRWTQGDQCLVSLGGADK
jgi:echinoderm microtubule-associated protein-like 6